MRKKQDVNKKNDVNKERGVDKGNNKSVLETLKAMFEIKSVGEPADKLKTQVKGYSVKVITESMLKKHKLGDAMAAVCDTKELEEKIRDSIKSGLPVYGFFREKKMWSCFLFDKVDIPRNELTPEPESGNDTLCIYRLRNSYVHPDAENVREDMAEVAHSNVYQSVLDVFGDGKTDGFMWKDRVYVCKREKSTGIPYGLVMGIALGIIYGMVFDNLALGISLGICFGISFSMIWGTSAHRYAAHGMTDGSESEDMENVEDRTEASDVENVEDGSEALDGENVKDRTKSESENSTAEDDTDR